MTWVRQAPGWYTSECGNIVRLFGHGAGWWWLPNFPRLAGARGPYRTLAEAKRAADR